MENSILKELKLDGLVNAEEDVVEHLEHGLSGSSVLFPIGRNKDGSLSQRSKALAPEEFDTVLAYTEQKEKDLKEQMYGGDGRRRLPMRWETPRHAITVPAGISAGLISASMAIPSGLWRNIPWRKQLRR